MGIACYYKKNKHSCSFFFSFLFFLQNVRMVGKTQARWVAWGQGGHMAWWLVMGEPYECEHGHTCIWRVDMGMGATYLGKTNS